VTVTVCRAEAKNGGKKGDEKSAFAAAGRAGGVKKGDSHRLQSGGEKWRQKGDEKSAFAAAGGASGVKKGDSHRLQRGGEAWRQKRVRVTVCGAEAKNGGKKR
jgi:hypothetical protein